MGEPGAINEEEVVAKIQEAEPINSEDKKYLAEFLQSAGVEPNDLDEGWQQAKESDSDEATIRWNHKGVRFTSDISDNFLGPDTYVKKFKSTLKPGYTVIANTRKTTDSPDAEIMLRIVSDRAHATWLRPGLTQIEWVQLRKDGEFESVSVHLKQDGSEGNDETEGTFYFQTGDKYGTFSAEAGKPGTNFIMDPLGDPKLKGDVGELIKEATAHDGNDINSRLHSLNRTALPGLVSSLSQHSMRFNGRPKEFAQLAINKMTSLSLSI